MLCVFLDRLTASGNGRQLDVMDATATMPEGRVMFISVPRSSPHTSVLAVASDEIKALIDNSEFDIRIPLEVDFWGEGNIVIKCNMRNMA